nr:transcription elongation factor, mitochondrial-like isoform X1 [Procambarus clarkii]XP_045600315.1 transcription elongation factor, mitochondrial-like isoform X1 [Procambarus clarkii]XP_045600316.1 transcription elongation factor, mitochondrial-like isoform X1 [Procambarus clarkii]XP_045600317.1 transcription elongation factor, mitochondrial-like isoform X1 [Procambarus clarkii]
MFLRSCLLHHTLQTGSLRSLKCLQYSTSFKSKQTPEENGKIYDLSSYELPYSLKEKDCIIRTINDASAADLARLNVTKGIIKKLMKSKSQVGSFQDVSQLFYIDGLGIKAIENICTSVLENKETANSSGDVLEDLKDVVYKKRLVKPKLSLVIRNTLETMVSLHVTAGALAWTKFDRSGKVLGFHCEELLSSDSQFDAIKIYEMVKEAAEKIPPADLYVWEELNSYGHLKKASLGTVIISLQLAQIKGIITTVLDYRQDSMGDRLVYLRNTLVPKLFGLQIGQDRAPGLQLTDKLMEGKQEIDWLPPLPLDQDIQESYFNIEISYRRYVASSLLTGLAFHQVILQHNNHALKILCK